MRYYKLGETPAYYITAWYNLLSGKWEFGKVHATETTVEGTTVELNTNGHHTTYEMKIPNPLTAQHPPGAALQLVTISVTSPRCFSVADTF